MKSPFDDLQVDPSLVCQFFAVFSRFEYAMKASRYCFGDHKGNATPNWTLLKAQVGGQILLNGAIASSIAYLVAEPPEVQKFVNGLPRFQAVALPGGNDGAKALEAARRVRNNLFHGGKHTAHSPAERDTKLIVAALEVLGACLAADGALNTEFEQQVC